MIVKIISSNVNQTTYEVVTKQVVEWAQIEVSKYICAANVHMLMKAWDDDTFWRVVNDADLVTPDGMPLVWVLRLKGCRNQQRVYGPTLMLHVLEMSARENVPVGFFGGKPEVLDSLVERMKAKYSELNVMYSYSPPFRSLTQVEDEQITGDIRRSGAKILFVALGCPKQERWMAAHRDLFSAVMVGVGAAFDFHAGVIKQAPVWVQKAGLEWLFRFFQEPRRLWKRYLIQNPRFVVLALADLLGILKISKN
jgi:N-acetylglucosaminyldiphosphoundecaprenol N-acetyl-beta-D-mannosaminyltransferase